MFRPGKRKEAHVTGLSADTLMVEVQVEWSVSVSGMAFAEGEMAVIVDSTMDVQWIDGDSCCVCLALGCSSRHRRALLGCTVLLLPSTLCTFSFMY